MSAQRAMDYAGYQGKYSIWWDYFNQDSQGLHPNTCCGQAAIFSALATQGKIPAGTSFKSFVRRFPPNNLFGSLGSSWQRIVEIIKANGSQVEMRKGETELRRMLRDGPVLVCTDVGAAGWGKWGLHWTTVFGYTSGFYFLSNWETNPWCTTEHFKAGWNSPLTAVATGSQMWGFAPR